MQAHSFFDVHTHMPFGTQPSVYQCFPFEQPANLDSFFSAGVHPQNSKESPIIFLNWLHEHLQHPNCLAIGECGLDSRYPDDAAQEDLFIAQLKLAKEINKPIILHCVNRIERCLFLHKQHAPDTPMIFHGFNKASHVSTVLKHAPIFVSIGASILHNKALQEAVKWIPLDRILAETDESLESIETIYETIAQLKQLPLSAIIESISKNVNTLFFHE